MSKPASGLFHGTAGDNAARSQLQAKARETVDSLIKNTSGSKKKAVAVGAYDERTGRAAAAFAGDVPSKIAPELRKRAEAIGGLGSLGLTEKNTVGVCAEFQVVNKLLLSGAKWEDIHLTPAIRPRTGKTIPFCANCKAMFYDLINQAR